tara:strand:+ start:394 stop:1764 length:1371 start_codon:yes stop_codon:yes gene_type:complete
MSNQPIIVLDAANIGWSAGSIGESRACSGKGLLEAINYCRKHGYNPIAFLPNNYLYNKNSKRLITDIEDVNEEVKKGSVIPVPPKDDDDLYMITYAQNKEAKLVSNDLFRDYISASEDSTAESWVKASVISYSFVMEEFFPNPKFKSFFENPSLQSTQSEPTNESVDETKPSTASIEPEPLVDTPTPITPITVRSRRAKILQEISDFDDSEDIERALGFRYYCHVCGDGFKKWGHANSHKKETGHGAYICGECGEILPSPKRANEHQLQSGHTTLTGTWVGQHEMRVKSLENLTMELIKSSNSDPESILRELVLNQKTEEKEYFIPRFTINDGDLSQSSRWPKRPLQTAQILHGIESLRGNQLTWKDCKNQLRDDLSIPSKYMNQPIQVFQSLFQPNSWTEKISWDSVIIDGSIFEKIFHVISNYVWSDGTSMDGEGLEQVADYLEDVKIFYTRLG